MSCGVCVGPDIVRVSVSVRVRVSVRVGVIVT